MVELINKRVKFFCVINGLRFKFEGKVIRETEFYYDIDDIKDGAKAIWKRTIEGIEVVDG